MRNLFVLIAIFVFAKINSQELTLIHINAKWNEKNNFQYIDELNGVRVQFGYLEDQPESIKKSIRSVPTLILMKNGRPLHVWNADISLKIKASIRDIQDIVNKHRFVTRRASTN